MIAKNIGFLSLIRQLDIDEVKELPECRLPYILMSYMWNQLNLQCCYLEEALVAIQQMKLTVCFVCLQ